MFLPTTSEAALMTETSGSLSDAALAAIRSLGAAESFLAVVATVRPDGSPHASLVNAGVLPHPLTDRMVGAFVNLGRRKLEHLRERPELTVTWRSGWSWITLEGRAELAGPDDALGGWTREEQAERLPGLLRDIFSAAGGTHDDWATYDRVMAEERRVAVLISPKRAYGDYSGA
jgi:PPOX class probable F420-dependent enzyme